MQLVLAIVVGAVGVLLLLAGVNGSGSQLLASFTGKGVPGDNPAKPGPVAGVNPPATSPGAPSQGIGGGVIAV